MHRRCEFIVEDSRVPVLQDLPGDENDCGFEALWEGGRRGGQRHPVVTDCGAWAD